MNLLKGNFEEHLRRNPQDVQGKLRGGGGDLVGDEEMQAEEWDELVAEGEGQFQSRIDDVGNAQDALMGGTGDLDHVTRLAKHAGKHEKATAEDGPELVNPDARIQPADADASADGTP